MKLKGWLAQMPVYLGKRGGCDVSNLRFTRTHGLYVGRGDIRILRRRIPAKAFSTGGLMATTVNGLRHGTSPNVVWSRLRMMKRRTI